MPPGSTRSLTERQTAVMERIDRRVPIKVIAQELGGSETRINQHIRALKDLYGASSLSDLVDMYRLEEGQKNETADEEKVQQSEPSETLGSVLIRATI